MIISTRFFLLNIMGKNRNNNTVYLAFRVGDVFRLSIREKSGVNIKLFSLGVGSDYQK